MRAEKGALPGLLVLSLAIASAAAMRGVLGPLQEVVQADLRMSDLQMSMVQGLAVSIPVAVLSIPIGRLIDRANRMRLLTALAVTWTVGAAGSAFAEGFYSLFAARMLAGLGAFCAIPVAISIAADLSPPERRGRSLLLLSLGQLVGGAAAFAVGGALSGALDAGLLGLEPWRAVSLIFGLASAALVVPLLLVREPVRHEVVDAAAAVKLGPALAALWERRAFLAPLFAGQVSVVMADTAAGIWAAPVLTRVFHQTAAQYGGWMGLVLLTAGLAGSIGGGLGADLGQKAKGRGGVLLGAVIAGAVSVPAAFFPLAPGIAVFAVLLCLLLIAGTAQGLITATTLAVTVPNEIRGVCLGAFVVVGAVVGLGVAPTLVTLVSNALGGPAHLAPALAWTGAVTAAMSCAAFLLAMRRCPPPVEG